MRNSIAYRGVIMVIACVALVLNLILYSMRPNEKNNGLYLFVCIGLVGLSIAGFVKALKAKREQAADEERMNQEQ